MPSQRRQAVSEQFLSDCLARSREGCSDRELLESFVALRDERAFTALVERHGAMVLGVCQRLLGNRHDAEDAYQATFLILARKADSIKKKDSLPSWLHGVAFRVAGNLRKQAARAKTSSASLDEVRGGDLEKEISWREVREALDEELARLDDSQRTPLVLCYLEGLTRDEAAQRLGWSLGMLRGRLDRGKRLLQNRLRRRGITLSVALLGLNSTANEALARTLGSVASRVAADHGCVSKLVSIRVAELVTCGAELAVVPASKLNFFAAVLLGILLIGGVTAWTPKFFGSAEEAKPNGRRPLESELPPHAIARLGTLNWRQGADVLALGVSPDGKTIATGSAEGQVVLWDTETGKRIRQWRIVKNHVYGVAFSPDGKLLAVLAAGNENRITLYQSRTGTKAAECVGHSRAPLALAFSQDGTRLTSAGLDQTIRHWDTKTGKEAASAVELQASVRKIWLSPRATFTVTLEEQQRERQGSLFTVVLRDAKTGRERVRDRVTHNASIAFSDDERFQVVANQGRFLLRGTSTGKTVWNKETPQVACTALELSSSRKMLIAGFEDGTVRCFDPITGLKTRKYSAHSGRIRGVAYLSGRGAIVSVGEDNRIHLATANGGIPLSARVGHLGELFDVMYSRDGKRIVTASADDSLIVWNARTGKEVHRESCPLRKTRVLDFSADSRVLVAADSDFMVRVREMSSEGQRSKFSALKIVKSWVTDLAVSASGATLFLGSSDGKIQIWDRSTKKVWTVDPGFVKHGPIPKDAEEIVVFSIAMLPNRVLSVDCDPEGSTFAVCSYREVVLWDVRLGVPRWRHPIAKVGHRTDVCYSPDGRRVAIVTRSTGVIQIREVSTGLLLSTFRPKSKNRTRVVQFSPEGRLLAIGTSAGVVHLLDAETGKNLRALRGHLGSVDGVAFSPDGSRLVTASGDTTALIWDIARLRPAAPREQPLSVEESERLWQILGSARDGVSVRRAMERLAAAPRETFALVQRASNRDESVRMRAKIDMWINQLDDNTFQSRESASAALEQMGREAEAALRAALAQTKSAEVRLRIGRLLKQLDGVPEGRLSLDQVRWLRVLELLERIGTRESGTMVMKLASNKSNPWLTTAARLVSLRLNLAGRK